MICEWQHRHKNSNKILIISNINCKSENLMHIEQTEMQSVYSIISPALSPHRRISYLAQSVHL